MTAGRAVPVVAGERCASATGCMRVAVRLAGSADSRVVSTEMVGETRGELERAETKLVGSMHGVGSRGGVAGGLVELGLGQSLLGNWHLVKSGVG